MRVTDNAPLGGDLTEDMLAADVWSDELVAAAGIPVIDKPFVTVGGGIGSFVTVDFLRIYGMSPNDIAVLSELDQPWQTYEFLTRCSQIPRRERLRSDSSSMPDNIWGFPSYALVEAWRERTLAPIINVLAEPILFDYWTPRAGTVFEGLEREANRIQYWSCVAKGQVRMIRRRKDNGYFVILTPPGGTSPTRRLAYRARVVHVAVGYPGLKFLPDLQNYRQTYSDFERVVNAYEPHEQVYDELNRRGGTVLVRGSGIVASRVLQRLIDDRETGAQTQIIHLFRTYISGSHGPNIFNRRRGGDGWAYQGFNYPKSVWGGTHWACFRRLEGGDREAAYKVIGGTNTPKRRSWLHQQARGRREGWYRTVIGEVIEVLPGTDGGVMTKIQRSDNGLTSSYEVSADFVIDCTGLEAEIDEHRLLHDLLDHGGAGRNVLGRLEVERTFEVRGTRNGTARMYASGAATLGGYFPGVDTFLGLQLAAREIADDMARQGMVKRLTSWGSVVQWIRRMRGTPV